MFKNRDMLFGLIIILVSIVIDQFTKGLALITLETVGSTKEIISGFFSFELRFNNGAAWSMFSGQFDFLMIMTILALIAFVFFFIKVDFKDAKVYSIAISLMIGGLFGNLIDRIFMDGNAVVDFLAFDFGSYSFPRFNIADSCLVVGVILFIFDVIFLEGKRNDE